MTDITATVDGRQAEEQMVTITPQYKSQTLTTPEGDLTLPANHAGVRTLPLPAAPEPTVAEAAPEPTGAKAAPAPASHEEMAA